MYIFFLMINYFKGGIKIFLKNVISLFKYLEKVKLFNSVFKWNKEDFFEFGDKVIKGVIEYIKIKFVVDLVEVEIIFLFGSLF